MTRDQLIESAKALLDLDARGALVPHGIGGHARTIIEGFLAAADTGARGAEPWKGPGEFKHEYQPDSAQYAGDCAICGHTYAAHHPAPARGAEPVQPVAWTSEANLRVAQEEAPFYQAVMGPKNTPEMNVPLYRGPHPAALAQPQASREARDRLQQQHDDFAHKAARETDPRLKERWSGIAVGLASAIAELARPQP